MNQEEPAPLPVGREGASDEVEGGAINSAANSERKGNLSLNNTPHGTAIDSAKGNKPNNVPVYPNFGGPIPAKSSGAFPAPGSTLGDYFSVGRLGKGTFSSIHRCINLRYFHRDSDCDKENDCPNVRLAAAKVELGEFRNSGVLLGEATMLHFLDSSLPRQSVPTYIGHLRAGEDISAIMMEYLPGQDMHWIRDWATKGKSRKIAVKDAVYLSAHVMLPLLQRMHEVGIVHRDVKPSNCVKRGKKDFGMVDFGLSKSIVVPKESTVSDLKHPFRGKDWIRPPHQSGEGHYRQERPTADFRGTSMYASVRVHQLKDYCPRDDMWSLLYVFCDLVSGGLPWMSHAANRDREACRKLKERMHGEEDGTPDQTERLLMGHEYHMALFNKFKGGIDPPEGVAEDDGTLPVPLPLSKDPKKVELLRKAFKHLGGLAFWDMPDYSLIRECMEGFLDFDEGDAATAPIDWDLLSTATISKRKANPLLGEKVPDWELLDIEEPFDKNMFQEAEAAALGEPEIAQTGEAGDLARLPLELQYRIAQMEYNTLNKATIPPDMALRDWLKTALPLVYGEWDSQKFERGGHRRNDDGYRRELLLSIVAKVLKCAKEFGGFHQHECIYSNQENGSTSHGKRRKISSTVREPRSGSLGSDLVAISQVLFRLKAAKKAESKKPRAPPPRLSFGSSIVR